MYAARRIWRPSRLVRVAAMLAAVLLAAGSASMIWAIAAGRDSGFGVAAFAAAFGDPLAAAYLFRWGQRARIILGEDALTVGSAMRVHRIPLRDVLRVSGGYYGLNVTVRGRLLPLTASAVQKPNWATWTGKHTRSDDVAAAIIEARSRLMALDASSAPDR
jgi:hypothetical protein